MKSFVIVLCPVAPSLQCVAEDYASLNQEQDYYQKELEKTKYKMFSYIMEHKLATAAIIATGGGLGAFLEEKMDDETRAVIMLMGIVGLGYCIDSSENAKECASVTAQLTSYAAVMGSLQEKVNSIDTRISSLHYSEPPSVAPPKKAGAVCISNSSDSDIVYSYRWGNGEWENQKLPSNKAVTHWWTYTSEENTSPAFTINYDNDYAKGLSLSQYRLSKYAAELPVKCGDAWEYYFEVSGQSIGLFPKDWIGKWKHPFRDHVVSSSKENSWIPAAGYKWYDRSKLSVIPKEYGIVGIALTDINTASFPKIAFVKPNSPASRAGIEKNWLVMEINEKNTRGMSSTDAVNILRGPAGEKVALLISDSAGKSRIYNIVRE